MRRSEEHTSELQSQSNLLFHIFFFNDPATTEISTLSLHDALPIYLLGMASRMGVRVLSGRVKDIKINHHEVSVEGESGGTRGDVLVGAFGLDSFTAGLLEKVTPYRRPRALYSIMAKIPAPVEYILGCEDYIHVFLPSMGEDRKSVVTPKLTH